VQGRLDPAVAKGRKHLREALQDLDPGERVTVALSGGADSLALAVCLSFLGPKAGWECRAVVVNHGLQSDSAQVAARAAAQARELGLAADVIDVVVDANDGGLEAAARTARYGALLEATAADGADGASERGGPILLGHTLDDQAETVLLGLGRGSGPRSIAGMPAVVGPFRRPFLGLRRVETQRICEAVGLEFWADPHNDDPRFRRSRLRREVMPLLEDVLGGLRSRVLRLAALDAGVVGSDLTAGHLDELDRLVTDWHGQARVELPGRISVVRDSEALRFVPTPALG
jgi:tRNA(Ile)-lysidine synthase